jgi:hypothetical protein
LEQRYWVWRFVLNILCGRLASIRWEKLSTLFRPFETHHPYRGRYLSTSVSGVWLLSVKLSEVIFMVR